MGWMQAGGVREAWAVVLGVFVCACGSKADEPGPASPPEKSGVCAESTAPPFSAGMSETSGGGVTVAVASADPAPPEQGENAWTVTVTDASGPIEGRTVRATIDMPRHGHPETVTLRDEGGGTYEAAPLDVGMPGDWTVVFAVPVDDGEEMIQFRFCVE
jgi:hypothetical protein